MSCSVDAELLAVDKLCFIDRNSEGMQNRWFRWIFRYVIRHKLLFLQVQCSLTTNCPEVILSQPFFLLFCSFFFMRIHIKRWALIPWTYPNARFIERVLWHLKELFMPTIGPSRWCDILGLLSDSVYFFTTNSWEVMIDRSIFTFNTILKISGAL